MILLVLIIWAKIEKSKAKLATFVETEAIRVGINATYLEIDDLKSKEQKIIFT